VAATSGFGGGDAAERKGVGLDMGATMRGREEPCGDGGGTAGIVWVATVRGTSVMAWHVRQVFLESASGRRDILILSLLNNLIL
jgi:hypothetical protein